MFEESYSKGDKVAVYSELGAASENMLVSDGTIEEVLTTNVLCSQETKYKVTFGVFVLQSNEERRLDNSLFFAFLA